MNTLGLTTLPPMRDPPAWQLDQLRQQIEEISSRPRQGQDKSMIQPATHPENGRQSLPLELQFEVLRHTITKLEQGNYWERFEGWKTLQSYLLVCRAWSAEICRVVARECSIWEVIQRGPSDSFVHDVLTEFLATQPPRKMSLVFAGYAAQRDFARSLQRLLDAGAKPCTETEECNLMYSALTYNRKGNYACVKLLVDGGYVKIEHASIYRAVDIANMELIRWLLDRGADPNREPAPSALRRACDQDRSDIVELLMERGATPNNADFNQFCWKPRHVPIIFSKDATAPQRGLAVAADHIDSGRFIKLCLEWGADPNVPADGMPILSMAVQKQLPTTCEMLLNAGANPNPDVAQHMLPLYCAASNGQSADIVRILCAFGAGVPPIAKERRRSPTFILPNDSSAPLKTYFTERIHRLSALNSPIAPAIRNVEVQKQGTQHDTVSSLKIAWRRLRFRR